MLLVLVLVLILMFLTGGGRYGWSVQAHSDSLQEDNSS
jgi:hypothetical protein